LGQLGAHGTVHEHPAGRWNASNRHRAPSSLVRPDHHQLLLPGTVSQWTRDL
jgi:hypothetical protein